MFTSIKNLLFPISCIACRQDSGTWLCQECQKNIIYDPQKQNYPEIDFPIYTLFRPNPIIRKLIHGLKYQWYEEASTLFHPYFADFTDRLAEKNITYIPAPLHAKKLRERGFNQSEKLIPPEYPKLFIQKIHNTRSQMGLDREERLINLHNAFQCMTDLPSDHHYIIVDDIVTTGSTMREIAKALRTAGAKKILGLALSRGT